MFKFVLLGTLCFAHAAAACVDAQTLQQLNQQELLFLSGRIPPAFADAVEDGLIQSSMQLQDAQACRVVWQILLPQADIDAARQVLDAQPARQIMLNAQGYQLPDSPHQQAVFTLDAAHSTALKSETLQTAPLGKLRASVELMYSMLTQQRADAPLSAVFVPWQPTQMQAALNQCASAGQTESACRCQIEHLSAQLAYRQWRYYQYLLSNPYAFASGQGQTIQSLERESRRMCAARSP